MEIIWSSDAVRDLTVIHEYIARNNPASAVATIQRIVDTVETYLSDQPGLGRAGRVHGTRELPIPPYILPYRMVGTQLEILRVYHEARQWPEQI